MSRHWPTTLNRKLTVTMINVIDELQRLGVTDWRTTVQIIGIIRKQQKVWREFWLQTRRSASGLCQVEDLFKNCHVNAHFVSFHTVLRFINVFILVFILKSDINFGDFSPVFTFVNRVPERKLAESNWTNDIRGQLQKVASATFS